MSKLTRDRYRLIEAMDFIIQHMNDEEGIEWWLMEGPGDGSNTEDYWDIAEDLVDEYNLFNNMVEVFVNIISEHGKLGFVCGDTHEMKCYGCRR